MSEKLWLLMIMIAVALVVALNSSRFCEPGNLECSSKYAFLMTSSGFFSQRNKRGKNDDAFSSLQSRISSLARVVNGITLYNRVVDGDYSFDKVMSEFLKIESMESVRNFEKTMATGFVEKITGATVSDKSKNIAKILVDLYKMKEMYSKIGDLSTLPNEPSIKLLDSMKGADLTTIQTIVIDDKSPVTSLNSLSSAIGNVMTKIKDNKIMETLKAMEPFNDFLRLIEFYTDSKCETIKTIQQSEIDTFKSEIEGLETITKEEGSAIPLMASVAGLSNSQMKYQFTSGFVNGYKDLKLLEKDVEDPWLIGEIGNPAKLGDIKQLVQLYDPMNQLVEKWAPVRQPSNRISIRKAESIQRAFGSFQGASVSADSLIGSLINATFVTKTVSLDMYKPARDQFEKLYHKLSALQQLQKLLSAELAKSTDPGSTKLLVEKVIPLLNEINADPKIEDIGHNIVRFTSFIAPFRTDVASYTTFFDSLKGFTDLTEQVMTASELALQLHDIKTDQQFSPNIDAAATSIADSKEPILQLMELSPYIAKPKNIYLGGLEQFKDLEKYSQPLFDYSAVINMIQKMLDKETELKDFIQNSHIVDDNGDIIKASADAYYKIRQNWKDTGRVTQTLSKLLREAKTWRNGIVKPTNGELKNYGPILESIPKLEDVVLDVELRLIAIDAVYKLFTALSKPLTPLESLKTSLEKVVDLDLSFSRYSLSGISNTLADIQKVLKVDHTPIPSSPIAPPPKKNPISIYRESTTEGPIISDALKSFFSAWYGIFTICVVVFLLLVAALAVFIHCRVRKQQQESLDRGLRAYVRRFWEKEEEREKRRAKRRNQKKQEERKKGKVEKREEKKGEEKKKVKVEEEIKETREERRKRRKKKKKDEMRPIPDRDFHGPTLQIRSIREDDVDTAIALQEEYDMRTARARERKIKEEYFEDQDDDDTLACVASIRNEEPPRKKKREDSSKKE